MTAVLPHQAIGGPMIVPGNLFVVIAGYLIPVAVLVVFGIWGFRLGAKHSGGNSGGGGPKRPEPTPTPPGGGKSGDTRVLQNLTIGGLLEPAGQEEQAQERERELVGPRS